MKKVLFIEDESGLQDAVTQALASADLEVISALDGEAGVRMARENIPDLILLDLILPKKRGEEVLKELKSDGATKSIPVVVLTNLEDTKQIEALKKAGAIDYLVKANFTLASLQKKVEELLA